MRPIIARQRPGQDKHFFFYFFSYFLYLLDCDGFGLFFIFCQYTA